MADDDLFFFPIRRLAHLLRRKEISSVELTRLYLDRLAALGPRYNALAELTPELALVQARRADRRLARGDSASLLLGIPYGAKDLLATQGIPTRWGAPPFRDQVPKEDATVIRRLADAGAVLIGKLAMVELAGGGGYAYPSASLNGPGLNPWDVTHWSGGSSSGSGIAVAAGLVAYALGSETLGSIINPAASCGITGLRPTWGLVSRFGVMELAWSMDKVGPMARSAEDCGLVLQAIAGADPLDETTAQTHFRFSPRGRLGTLRMGIPSSDLSEPGLEKAYDDALRSLRRMGVRTRPIELDNKELVDIAGILLRGESAAAFGSLVKSGRVEELLDEGQREGLKKALDLTAAEYVEASKRRAKVRVRIRELFREFDLIVSPSLLTEPVPIDTNLKTMTRRWGNYTALGALCGDPQITLPIGQSPNGLPFGISLIGDCFSDNLLLQVGMAFQRETDWHIQRPPKVTSSPSTR